MKISLPSAKPWPALSSVLGFALVLVVTGFYLPVLIKLFRLIATNEDYSFALLLPLVSGYIVYLKWGQIRQRHWQPSWMGLVFIALGFTLNLFGGVSANLSISSISFTISLLGVLLLLGGWGMASLLAFPLILLILMVPFGSVISTVTLPLQLSSSHLAAWFLQTLGVPVVRQGNVIDLGVRQLQVVAACSGLRYILSLLALGLIYCYFFQRSVWKAAIIIIAIIPLAILANALRVAAMGIYPALQEEGFLHSFSGWLIFIFCFGFLGLLNKTMNYLQRPAPPLAEKKHSTESPLTSRETGIFLYKYLVGGLILILLLGPLTLKIANFNYVSLPLRQSFDQFPLKLGPWQGKRIYINPAEEKTLQSDHYIDIQFVNPQQQTASLWIAYYGAQNAAGPGFHPPDVCLTGGGWGTITSKTIELAPGKPVRYMLIDRSGERMVVYYWYLQRGRWIADDLQLKLYRPIDTIFRGRADGALVRLMTPATPDLKSAHERLTAFAKLVIPLLPQFMQK